MASESRSFGVQTRGNGLFGPRRFPDLDLDPTAKRLGRIKHGRSRTQDDPFVSTRRLTVEELSRLITPSRSLYLDRLALRFNLGPYR